MKKICIKISKYLMAFTMLVSMFSSFVPSEIVQAATTEAPDSLELGAAVNSGITVNLTHFPTKYLADKTPAFCLDHHKTTAENMTVYKESKLDYRYTILYKNFSLLPYSGHERYFIEQLSVHWLEDRINGISDNVSGELTKNLKNRSTEYVNWARKIVNLTMNTKRTANKVSVKTSTSTLTLTPEGKYQYIYYETQPITALAVGDGEMTKYKVSLVGAPKGTRILTMDNKGSNTFDAGEQFKILVPAENVSSNTSFKVVLYGTYVMDYMYKYAPKTSTYQSITPKKLYQETSTVTSSQFTFKINYTNIPDDSGGNLLVVKKDTSGTAIANAEIKIVNPEGSAQTYKTDSNGKISLTGIDTGTYTITEVNAPTGYLLNSEEYQVEVEEDKTGTITITNEEPIGSISITKVDKQLGDTAQADAVLEGAIFEVRAKTDLYNASGSTLIYKANELVGTLETREDGTTNALPVKAMGTYVIQETMAPTGYVIDLNKYDVTLSYKDQKTEVVSASKTISNQVMKQAFTLVKASSEKVDGNTIYLKDAEFTYILKAHVEQYGSFEKALAAAKKGEIHSSEWGSMKSDANGVATSKELPYGTYVVRETMVPEEHYAIEDFEVNIQNDSRTPQSYGTFVDEKFSALLQVIKKDKETNKQIAIADTQFKVKALSDVIVNGKKFTSGEYISIDATNIWKTDETGTFTFDTKLGVGKYQVEEVKAPTGYINDSEKAIFEISKNETYELAADKKTALIKVTLSDTSVKGKLVVTKVGEVLVDAKKDNDGNYTFMYEEKALANATYEIYADEDIMDPSNDGNVLYQKDTKIAEITTKQQDIALENKENVYASYEDLPLGKYYVKEKTAPVGFVLNTEKYKVHLKYENDTVAVVTSSMTVKNERQKIAVALTKKDREDGTLLEGAQFVLLTKEDILSYDGKVLVKANSVVEEATSNKEGKVLFDADLPLYTYEIKEITAPKGYVLKDQIIKLDGTYQGQNVKTIELNTEIMNDATKVEFSKIDVSTEAELPGATQIVYLKDQPENIIETWISTDTPHIIKGLEVGETYVWEEVSAPDGYVKAEKIEFTVKDTDEIQSAGIMKDDHIRVAISKLDSDQEFVAGATLQLLPLKEDGLLDEEAFVPFVSENHEYVIEYLPVGTYVVRELMAPVGYVKAKDMVIEVKETAELQKFEMLDKQVIVHKVEENGKYVEGATLSVFDLEGNEIDTWITNKEGHAVNGLEVGKEYILKEMEVPEGYTKANDQSFIVDDSLENQEYKMVDKLIVVTGDSTNLSLWIRMTGISFIVIAFLVMLNLKRKEE